MATASMLTSCSDSICHNNNHLSIHSHKLHPSSSSSRRCFLPVLGKTNKITHHSLQYFFRSNLKQHGRLFIFKAASDDPSSVPQPPNKSPFPGWQWMMGILLSVVIPVLRTKGGPLVLLKNNLDKAMETVEEVVEVVEEIAHEVDKVAEDIEKKLPGDSKLKKSLDSIENLAEQAVSYAKQAEGVINKVEEIEKQIEEEYLKAKRTNEGQDTTGME
ncbi:PREDICTED: uncharacterized protein LOC109172458 [Ipomoea nil]|uniref:uncharacterized protein LOC109172458 n=1 Tax=Ipomoea nil TaxID=35883 RepID=UPI000900BC2A|nr:PREDICTED: uncharacterized protein LOC109172458 [Ipomoea nil]